jgi:hypothetical protein
MVACRSDNGSSLLLLLLLLSQVGYIAYPGKQLLWESGADIRLEEQLLKVRADGAPQSTPCLNIHHRMWVL